MLPKYNKETFLSDVYIDDGDYHKLVSLLKHKKNIIIQGPLGVGKTYQKNLNSETLDDLIIQVKDLNQEIVKDPSLGNGHTEIKPLRKT